MSGWSIDTASARSAISGAKTHLDAAGEHGKETESAFNSGADAAVDTKVRNALDSLLNDFMTPLTKAVKEAGANAVSDTREAINAYVSGDEDMAATSQRHASEASSKITDGSLFEKPKKK